MNRSKLSGGIWLSRRDGIVLMDMDEPPGRMNRHIATPSKGIEIFGNNRGFHVGIRVGAVGCKRLGDRGGRC